MVPAEHQGKAMGIAGAGNSGTVFAALLAPVLAAAFGWSNVFGFALIPLVLTLIVFAWLARNAPERPKAKSMADYFKALGDRDSWWFMFFYSVTFGGFIGLASALPGYFNDQYGLSPVTAGYYTAACVFGGSLMRPLGGALADRFGGIRTLLACTAWQRSASRQWVSTCQVPTRRWRFSSAPCSAWVQVMAQCSNWCRSVFAEKSA